jgi:hypothetical protein
MNKCSVGCRALRSGGSNGGCCRRWPCAEAFADARVGVRPLAVIRNVHFWIEALLGLNVSMELDSVNRDRREDVVHDNLSSCWQGPGAARQRQQGNGRPD